MKNKIFLFLLLIFVSCEPVIDTMEEVRDAIDYSKDNAVAAPSKDTILVMTWNIRFGCGADILWFGDACGGRTILTRDEVTTNLNRVIEEINRIHPDVLLLQEVDIKTKRVAYIDQMKYIMDRTYFGWGTYATSWNIQFIPSDGIGRMDFGNAILSVWPLSKGTHHPLPLRGDLDALTKSFYVRENAISCHVAMPNGREFNVANVHLSAFATDDTKHRQLETYLEICESLTSFGSQLIMGGDFNLLPPNSDSLDYCDEDMCEGESFHAPGDDPMHKDGSNYAPEIDWMNLVYEKFYSSLPLDIYKPNQRDYFTHSTNPDTFWDRTLDYLFASSPWVSGSHITHQDLRVHSDHAAVSALIKIEMLPTLRRVK
ncbi:MAG: endonuclease/exonuclease/phosphatase family protein [bacterium]